MLYLKPAQEGEVYACSGLESLLSNLELSARPFLAKPASAIFCPQRFPMRACRVLTGCVALTHRLSDGRRQIIDVLGPGRIFGFEGSIADDQTVEALTYSDIEPLSATSTVPLREPAWQQALVRSQSLITMLGRRSAQEKVAYALLDLEQQFAVRREPTTARHFPLYLSRADLGDWLGLTVETVSRCLSAFRRDRLVDFRKPESITLTDRDALARLAAF